MSTDTPEPVLVKLRGSGGVVWEFELERALMASEPLLAQIAQGTLRPADSASATTLTNRGVKVGP